MKPSLSTWLRAVAVHATSMRGLVATRMASVSADTALADCHDATRSTGEALLDRARQAGAAPEGARAGDLLTLVNAIAWAGEQAPEDEGLLDRLLVLAGLSLPPEPGRSCPGRW